MAFHLELSAALRKARWKVKIRDKEIRESPHVTIIRGRKAWRVNLRTGEFMDADPDPALVSTEIMTLLREAETWRRLRDAWNEIYPDNPVSGDESVE